jgi:hypothetical protein
VDVQAEDLQLHDPRLLRQNHLHLINGIADAKLLIPSRVNVKTGFDSCGNVHFKDMVGHLHCSAVVTQPSNCFAFAFAPTPLPTLLKV